MRALPAFIFLFTALVSPGRAGAQVIDYSDLPGLRTMANSPTGTQRGMEVGDVNVPSVTQQGQDKKELPEEKPAPELQRIFFDTNKIDPDSYILGAEDLISLYMWDKLDQEYPLSVTPEGTVVIPTVGVVEIGGLTLTQAKERIGQAVHKKYQGIQLSITLTRPRYFRVIVSGVVNNPGLVESHALQRVSDVIDKAHMFFQEFEIVTENRLRAISSQRRITVQRGEKTIPVDLLVFRKFGDLSANPYISAGDIIDVPPALGNMFVYGAVNDPGRYEYKPGDRIADLVRFGGGLFSTADTTRATLARFDEKGITIAFTDINLYDAVFNHPDDPRFSLREFDRLYVRTQFQFKTLANVELVGEVKYPGSYAIIPNETTLSDVFNMAGGPTDKANLEESRFIRVSAMIPDPEYTRLSKMLMADMTDEEADYFRNLSRTRAGELSLDFVKLFRNNDPSYDIPLQDRDRVTVPAKREFVHVMGAIQQPGFLKVEPGRDVSYYIAKAGGYNWNAKASKTRVIKAQTGQRFRPSKRVIVESGDTINVPEKRPADLWAFTKDAALMFANVATVIILARQITK